MLTDTSSRVPERYLALLERSLELEFSMNSDVQIGSLLRTLAASKPGGSFLELGTGCGVGTSWLLDGMTADARLISVDSNEVYQSIVRDELGNDPRLTLHLGDAGQFIENADTTFDLIYADAWPGKFSHLDAMLGLVEPGGIYLVDDMLPQPNWPLDHDVNVAALLERLRSLRGFATTQLSWSTGIVICVKTAGA